MFQKMNFKNEKERIIYKINHLPIIRTQHNNLLISKKAVLKIIKEENLSKIEIELKKLREIAEYYQFPLAMFFTPLGYLKGTRNYADAYEKLCEIKEILEK